MDFMDDDMKEIAMEAFHRDMGGTTDGVYAACEAVLAEQKRQKEAWDGYPPLEEAHEATSEVAQKIGNQMLQNLRRNVSEERKQEPQMDATMADEVRQPAAICQYCGPVCLGHPAEDVVQRMHSVYGREHDHQKGLGADRDTCERYGLAAALAVAREGMVPASEPSPAVLKAMLRFHKKRAQIAGQQLSTMYSLEQVEKAVRQVYERDLDIVLRHLRICLTVPQQPTKGGK